MITLETTTVRPEIHAISESGSLLLTTKNHHVQIWNADNGELVDTLFTTLTEKAEGIGAVYSIAISPDEKWIAVGGYRCAAAIYNRQTLELKNTVLSRTFEMSLPTSMVENYVQKVQFSPDSRTLLTVDGRGSIQLWDVETGKEITRWHESYRESSGASQYGWATFLLDRNLAVSHNRTSEYEYQFKKHDRYMKLNHVKLDEDDEWGNLLRSVAIVEDLNTGDVKHVFPCDRFKVLNGNVLFTTYTLSSDRGDRRDYTVRRVYYDLETGRRLKVIECDDKNAQFINFDVSPNLNLLAGIKLQHAVPGWEILDIDSLTSKQTFHVDGLLFDTNLLRDSCIEFFPDGKKVLTMSRNQRPMIWDVNQLNERAQRPEFLQKR